jgi:hypothetical protein
MISFVQGEDPISVPIETKKLGTLRFFFGQTVEAMKIKDGKNMGSYKLRTLEYRYRIQEEEGPRALALVRWEYKRVGPSLAGHPRHHLHVSCTLSFGKDAACLDLKKVHLSTGWVTIEEVIRFIINELQHRPPCGDRWPAVIHKSETLFFDELSGKGCPNLGRGCPYA